MSDTVRIEKLGINELENILLQNPNLEPHISDNDKTPSYDGHIFVKDANTNDKAHNHGLVRVQVKSTTTIEPCDNGISFSVDIADIKQYLTNQGVLFFVVCLGKVKHGVYYAKLLPFDLVKILKENNSKKATRIHFDPFPGNTDLEAMTYIFTSYLVDQRKQAHIQKPDQICSLSEINSLFSVALKPSVTLATNCIPQADYVRLLSTQPFYIYAEVNKLGLSIPLERVDNAKSYKRIGKTISSGQRVYYDFYMVEYEHGVPNIQIGAGIKVYLEDTCSRISYTPTGSLKARIKDLEFVISTIENLTVFIGDVPLRLKKYEDIICEQVKRLLSGYISTQAMLISLDVHADLDCDSLTNDEIRSLNNLIDAVNHNRHIPLDDASHPYIICNFKIANLHFITWAEKDSNDLYSIKPISQAPYLDLPCPNTDDSFPCSPYLFLSSEYIANACNLDFEKAYTSITGNPQIDNVFCNTVVLFTLSLLDAFDKQQDPDVILINLTVRLCDWLYIYCDDSDCDIIRVNKYQAIKRISQFDDYATEDLLKLINNDNPNIKICSMILLDRFDDAHRLVATLPNTSETHEFLKQPIFHLLPTR